MSKCHIVENHMSWLKSHITVLVCMSASAHYLPPLIVFPGQRFFKNILEGFEEAVLGRSNYGWMDSDLFVMWLKTVLEQGLNERQVEMPVLLFVDGHTSHISQEASDFCVEKHVVLYSLLKHASHLIQPCDLRLFRSLKKILNSVLRDWQIRQYVTQFEFASIFKHSWNKSSKG